MYALGFPRIVTKTTTTTTKNTRIQQTLTIFVHDDRSRISTRFHVNDMAELQISSYSWALLAPTAAKLVLNNPTNSCGKLKRMKKKTSQT